MKKPIILLSGGTGVGTSTFSFELAKAINLPTIISTDSIREVIRSILHEDVNPTLGRSTYAAGQTVNYPTKPDDVKKSEIIRAYKTQCEAIHIGVQGVIKRAIEENVPLVIEGVHLIPGKIHESPLYNQYQDRFAEYLIYIGNPEKHENRFVKRQQDAPSRKMNKYLNNFQEIRWIHDYLLDRARRFDNIGLINNEGTIREGLDCLLEAHYSKRD